MATNYNNKEMVELDTELDLMLDQAISKLAQFQKEQAVFNEEKCKNARALFTCKDEIERQKKVLLKVMESGPRLYSRFKRREPEVIKESEWVRVSRERSAGLDIKSERERHQALEFHKRVLQLFAHEHYSQRKPKQRDELVQLLEQAFHYDNKLGKGEEAYATLVARLSSKKDFSGLSAEHKKAAVAYIERLSQFNLFNYSPGSREGYTILSGIKQSLEVYFKQAANDAVTHLETVYHQEHAQQIHNVLPNEEKRDIEFQENIEASINRDFKRLNQQARLADPSSVIETANSLSKNLARLPKGNVPKKLAGEIYKFIGDAKNNAEAILESNMKLKELYVEQARIKNTLGEYDQMNELLKQQVCRAFDEYRDAMKHKTLGERLVHRDSGIRQAERLVNKLNFEDLSTSAALLKTFLERVKTLRNRSFATFLIKRLYDKNDGFFTQLARIENQVDPSKIMHALNKKTYWNAWSKTPKQRNEVRNTTVSQLAGIGQRIADLRKKVVPAAGAVVGAVGVAAAVHVGLGHVAPHVASVAQMAAGAVGGAGVAALGMFGRAKSSQPEQQQLHQEQVLLSGEDKIAEQLVPLDTSDSALHSEEIERRARGIQEIEDGAKVVGSLFKDSHELIKNQGLRLNTMEGHINNARQHTQDAYKNILEIARMYYLVKKEMKGSLTVSALKALGLEDVSFTSIREHMTTLQSLKFSVEHLFHSRSIKDLEEEVSMLEKQDEDIVDNPFIATCADFMNDLNVQYKRMVQSQKEERQRIRKGNRRHEKESPRLAM